MKDDLLVFTDTSYGHVVIISDFPNDESLLKILYLATIDITKKWI